MIVSILDHSPDYGITEAVVPFVLTVVTVVVSAEEVVVVVVEVVTAETTLLLCCTLILGCLRVHIPVFPDPG